MSIQLSKYPKSSVKKCVYNLSLDPGGNLGLNLAIHIGSARLQRSNLELVPCMFQLKDQDWGWLHSLA